MPSRPILTLCLLALAACGGGDPEFASRFADAAADGTQPGSGSTADASDTSDDDATQIALTGGTPKPARRAFPDNGTDENNLLSYSADPAAFDPIDATAPGSGSFTGTYQATKLGGLNSSNPADQTVEGASGAVSLTVNLNSGQARGQSSDGRLLIGRAADPLNGSDFNGSVVFDGIAGPFEGTVTQSRAEADFVGQTASTGFFGSFDAVAVP